MPSSSWDQRVEAYRRLRVEADLAKARGDRRLAADKSLDAFRAEPTKIDPERYPLWCRYKRLSGGHNVDPHDDRSRDFKAVREIINDPNELTFYRATAAHHLASLHMACFEGGGIWDAAEAYRLAIELYHKIDDYQWTYWVIHEEDLGREPVRMKRRVGGLVSNHLTLDARRSLEEIQQSPLRERAWPGYAIPFPDFDVSRVTAGGDKCDACGAPAEHTKITVCTRCERVFACSEFCAHRLWDGGHDKTCRRPGEIEEGDFMVLKGLKSKPEYNRQVVKVLKQQGDRWQVQLGNEARFKVATEKLVHVRPVKT